MEKQNSAYLLPLDREPQENDILKAKLHVEGLADIYFCKDPNDNSHVKLSNYQPQQLIITTKEEIKSGDWYLSLNKKATKWTIAQCSEEMYFCNKSHTPKVIAAYPVIEGITPIAKDQVIEYEKRGIIPSDIEFGKVKLVLVELETTLTEDKNCNNCRKFHKYCRNDNLCTVGLWQFWAKIPKPEVEESVGICDICINQQEDVENSKTLKESCLQCISYCNFEAKHIEERVCENCCKHETPECTSICEPPIFVLYKQNKITDADIHNAAIKKYGNSPFNFGGQRDGFKEGVKSEIAELYYKQKFLDALEAHIKENALNWKILSKLHMFKEFKNSLRNKT